MRVAEREREGGEWKGRKRDRVEEWEKDFEREGGRRRE